MTNTTGTTIHHASMKSLLEDVRDRELQVCLVLSSGAKFVGTIVEIDPLVVVNMSTTYKSSYAWLFQDEIVALWAEKSIEP